MTQESKPDHDRLYEQLLIKSYTYWDLYLHENQCYLGRTFLMLNDNESADDFLAIEGAVRDEFFQAGRAVKGALKTLFNPDKMNYAALGNVCAALHVHIIPRYQDSREFNHVQFIDQRWGKNYAPYDRSFVLELPMLLKIKEAIKEQL